MTSPSSASFGAAGRSRNSAALNMASVVMGRQVRRDSAFVDVRCNSLRRSSSSAISGTRNLNPSWRLTLNQVLHSVGSGLLDGLATRPWTPVSGRTGSQTRAKVFSWTTCHDPVPSSAGPMCRSRSPRPRAATHPSAVSPPDSVPCVCEPRFLEGDPARCALVGRDFAQAAPSMRCAYGNTRLQGHRCAGDVSGPPLVLWHASCLIPMIHRGAVIHLASAQT